MKLITLIVPCYNEEATIDLFYGQVCQCMADLPQYDFEVLCIDDGSKDRTLEKLVQICAADSRFRVLELSRNFGKEAALTAGLDAARGHAVIPMDVDLQDPLDLVPRMLELWEQGNEVVLARRADRSTDSILKRYSAK